MSNIQKNDGNRRGKRRRTIKGKMSQKDVTHTNSASPSQEGTNPSKNFLPKVLNALQIIRTTEWVFKKIQTWGDGMNFW
jgi:hypothetical protein